MGILKDKVALVTGSSRVGAAVAKVFAREGARVAIPGRDGAVLSRVGREIECTGSRVTQVVADITKFAEIESVLRQIECELGPVVVANAGGSFTNPGPIEETSEEDWRASADGNLTATFLTIKSFLPGMKERKAGNIITISSAAGRRPHPRAPIAYAVSGPSPTQRRTRVDHGDRRSSLILPKFAIGVNVVKPSCGQGFVSASSPDTTWCPAGRWPWVP